MFRYETIVWDECDVGDAQAQVQLLPLGMTRERRLTVDDGKLSLEGQFQLSLPEKWLHTTS